MHGTFFCLLFAVNTWDVKLDGYVELVLFELQQTKHSKAQQHDLLPLLQSFMCLICKLIDQYWIKVLNFSLIRVQEMSNNRLKNELGSRETEGCDVSSGNETGLVLQLLWFVTSFIPENFHLNRRLRKFNYSCLFAIIIHQNFSKKQKEKKKEKWSVK